MNGRIWIEFQTALFDIEAMKVASPRRAKGDATLLDQATDQLLKAVKARLLKKHDRADYAKLRKEGYSDRFLARLEAV